MRYKRCVTFALIAGGLFVSSSAFATSYSYDVNVKFNFNSKLGVTITDADIKILDLAPGTSADSNIVGITISTNNVAGYTAEATVGNAQNATTNMTHTNGTNTFASIATDASQASLTTDNTWGYAVSTDNGSSWSNFSGLPVYTEDGKQLASTDSPASDAIQFKINAKAATSQPAGDYTNVINFKVVANVPERDFTDVIPDNNPVDPVTNLPTMQSINENICDLVQAYDTQFQVTDYRDHSTYWISKLRDGHCWMTQNLDLNLDSTKTYTSTDTDLNSKNSWRPAASTLSATELQQDDLIAGWITDTTEPQSVDVGDWYHTGTYYTSQDHTYIAGDVGNPPIFSQDPFQLNGTHGHVGNYYNFMAAVAENDISSYNQSDEYYPSLPDSICPAGWRLPISYGNPNNDYSIEEYRDLRYFYNLSSITGQKDQDYMAAPFYQIRGESVGFYGNLRAGYSGEYWYATIQNGFGQEHRFISERVYVSSSDSTRVAKSVRCMVRDSKVRIKFDPNYGSRNDSIVYQNIKIGEPTVLYRNNFTRSGYIFNGWNTERDGKGSGYKDGDVITLSQFNIGSGVLYAQWLKNDGSEGGISDGQGGYETGITIQRAYELAYTQNHKGMYEQDLDDIDDDGDTSEYIEITDGHYHNHDVRFAMQDIDMTYNDNGTNKKVCDLVTVLGDQYQALDVRDNKLYYISKLADGKCWMTQNLDLDLSPNRTLSPTDTDVTTAWTPAYATNDIHWSNATTEEHYKWMRGVTPNSVDFGDYYWQGRSNVPDEGQQFVDPKPFTDFYDLSGNVHYHLGNYYTFAAALATNDGSVYGDNQVVNNQSICPKGWRLPDASNSVGSINYLNGLYASSGPYAAPLYMHPAEHWNDVSDRLDNIEGFEKAFTTAYYTLNRTANTSVDSTDANNYQKMRYFHPGGASGIPSPDTIPQAYPSIPRYLSIPVRCLAR